MVFGFGIDPLYAVGDGVFPAGVIRRTPRCTDDQSPDGRALADRWRGLISDRLIPVGKSAMSEEGVPQQRISDPCWGN